MIAEICSAVSSSLATPQATITALARAKTARQALAVNAVASASVAISSATASCKVEMRSVAYRTNSACLWAPDWRSALPLATWSITQALPFQMQLAQPGPGLRLTVGGAIHRYASMIDHLVPVLAVLRDDGGETGLQLRRLYGIAMGRYQPDSGFERAGIGRAGSEKLTTGRVDVAHQGGNDTGLLPPSGGDSLVELHRSHCALIDLIGPVERPGFVAAADAGDEAVGMGRRRVGVDCVHAIAHLITEHGVTATGDHCRSDTFSHQQGHVRVGACGRSGPGVGVLEVLAGLVGEQRPTRVNIAAVRPTTVEIATVVRQVERRRAITGAKLGTDDREQARIGHARNRSTVTLQPTRWWHAHREVGDMAGSQASNGIDLLDGGLLRQLVDHRGSKVRIVADRGRQFVELVQRGRCRTNQGRNRLRYGIRGFRPGEDFVLGIGVGDAVIRHGGRIARRNHTTILIDLHAPIRTLSYTSAAKRHLERQGRHTQCDRCIGDQLPTAVAIDRALLHQHQQARCDLGIGIGIAAANPGTCTDLVQAVVLGCCLIFHQYPGPSQQRDPINGLQPIQSDGTGGGSLHRILEVLPGQLLSDPFTGSEDNRRIDLQLYQAGGADDQVQAYHLGTARALAKQRFVGGCAVGHGDHVAVSVVQRDFADPTPSYFCGDDLLGDDHRTVLVVHLELIQRCATPFVDQAGIDCVFPATASDRTADDEVRGRRWVDVEFIAVLQRAAQVEGATAFEADHQAGQVAADRSGIVDLRRQFVANVPGTPAGCVCHHSSTSIR
ncbi:hypothetical protein WR25_05797 [Diploscapter pachys]|uniref:Uncharacterized protein n=1 Tax=Diploscapter pachys TaxID=2018661 RepID=A0A2A2K5D1_9BILA|nr:hypothetical protein WR25_05797 [Diploscapter pachys]